MTAKFIFSKYSSVFCLCVSLHEASVSAEFVSFMQTPCSHAVLSVHPALRPGSVLSAVRLGHGAGIHPAHKGGDHESKTAGPGQSPVSLPQTGSYGKV